MAHTQGLILTPRNLHSAAFVELQQSLSSQIQVISPFVGQLMRFIMNFWFADGSEVDIETAVREALANAVLHGNGENPSKHVQVECRCCTDGEVFDYSWGRGTGVFTAMEYLTPQLQKADCSGTVAAFTS